MNFKVGAESINRLGHEADDSTPSSAEVKDTWSYTSTPSYTFTAWCFANYRDNFTSHLPFTLIS